MSKVIKFNDLSNGIQSIIMFSLIFGLASIIILFMLPIFYVNQSDIKDVVYKVCHNETDKIYGDRFYIYKNESIKPKVYSTYECQKNQLCIYGSKECNAIMYCNEILSKQTKEVCEFKTKAEMEKSQ